MKTSSRLYLQNFAKWFAKNRENLSALYDAFLIDTGQTKHVPGASFDEFCVVMFENCKASRYDTGRN